MKLGNFTKRARKSDAGAELNDLLIKPIVIFLIVVLLAHLKSSLLSPVLHCSAEPPRCLTVRPFSADISTIDVNPNFDDNSWLIRIDWGFKPVRNEEIF